MDAGIKFFDLIIFILISLSKSCKNLNTGYYIGISPSVDYENIIGISKDITWRNNISR